MGTILPETGPPVEPVLSAPAESWIDSGVERGPWIEACRRCITRHWDIRGAAMAVLDRAARQ